MMRTMTHDGKCAVDTMPDLAIVTDFAICWFRIDPKGF
jgi:hypothetical protein